MAPSLIALGSALDAGGFKSEFLAQMIAIVVTNVTSKNGANG